ncbi:MAG: hypothetical protein PHH19_03415 [Eubacteriales bacterium]|nr:hypothetical protein [Eubacteriales bacterium]
MSIHITNLSFLMNELDISGVEIAQALNIDPTLVSKWKNNTRPLKPDSTLLEGLVTYLLKDDENNQQRLSYIKELLTNFSAKYNNNDLKEKLKHWLTSKHCANQAYIMQKFYSTRLNKYAIQKQSLIFMGNTGRREALNDFLNVALEDTNKLNIYITIQEDLSWMIDDEIFLNDWLKKLEMILTKGNKIYVLYWINRPMQELSYIFSKYLPLYLHQNIKPYYFPKYSMPVQRNSIFLIENKMGLLGIQGATPADRYSELYFDEKTLSHYKWVMENLICNSKKMCTHVKQLELNNIDKKSLSLVVKNKPSFYSMPEKLFNSLINDNIFSEEESNILNNAYKESQRYNKPKRHIYSLKELNEQIQKPFFYYDDINKLLEREKLIPISYFKKHINSFFETNSDGNKIEEYGFTNEDIPVNVNVVDENYFLIWNYDINSKYCLFNELNLTTAIYFHYEKMWNNIPRIYKESGFLTTL